MEADKRYEVTIRRAGREVVVTVASDCVANAIDKATMPTDAEFFRGEYPELVGAREVAA